MATNRLRTLIVCTALLVAGAASAGPKDLVIALGGDTSYHHGWFDPKLEKIGADPGPFNRIQSYLDEADLRFLNLETAVTEGSAVVKKKYSLAMPPHRLAWIVKAGWNLISLANNHSMDAGLEGLQDTIRHLTEARDAGHPMWWAGADPDPAKADAITWVDVEGKDLKIAFLAFGNNRAKEVASFWGKRVHQRIRSAREKADLVLVSIHAGAEYDHLVKPDEARRYRALIDAGADVVIGHHPHVVRGVERYKDGVILYSLGNLSFASFTVRHRETGAKMWGLLPMVYVTDGKLARLRLVPLWVSHNEKLVVEGADPLPPAPFQPQPLKGAHARAMLGALQEYTTAIDGNATRLHIDGDEANLDLTGAAGGSGGAAN